MTNYQCSSCYHIQTHNNGCDNCHRQAIYLNTYMQIARDAQKTGQNINIGLYGDGGCCDCSKKKRRIFALVISGIFLILLIKIQTNKCIYQDLALEQYFFLLLGYAAPMVVVTSIAEDRIIMLKYENNKQAYNITSLYQNFSLKIFILFIEQSKS